MTRFFILCSLNDINIYNKIVIQILIILSNLIFKSSKFLYSSDYKY